MKSLVRSVGHGGAAQSLENLLGKHRGPCGEKSRQDCARESAFGIMAAGYIRMRSHVHARGDAMAFAPGELNRLL